MLLGFSIREKGVNVLVEVTRSGTRLHKSKSNEGGRHDKDSGAQQQDQSNLLAQAHSYLPQYRKRYS